MQAQSEMEFVSWAQYKEDLILYKFLYDIDNGFYVDVGANDPDEISVTKFFYLRGWRGINIEPLPDKFALLTEKRSNDINVNCAVSTHEGTLQLKLRGACSTLISSEPMPDKVGGGTRKNCNDKDASIAVHVTTLTKILSAHINDKQDIHFLKIDVEGWEREVLLSLDQNRFKPWVLCIESQPAYKTNPGFLKWHHLLKENYTFFDHIGINRYYLRKDLAVTLSEHFNKRYDIVIPTENVSLRKKISRKFKAFSKRLRGK